MQATLGRERLKSSDLPASSRLLTVKWQGLDIDAIRTDTSQAGAPLTVYTAQVPLRREAIQVVVAGAGACPPRGVGAVQPAPPCPQGRTTLPSFARQRWRPVPKRRSQRRGFVCARD